MSKNQLYIQVFSDGRISLSYPARLWATMSDRDRAGVVQRQAKMAAQLRRAMPRKTAVPTYR